MKNKNFRFELLLIINLCIIIFCGLKYYTLVNNAINSNDKVLSLTGIVGSLGVPYILISIICVLCFLILLLIDKYIVKVNIIILGIVCFIQTIMSCIITSIILILNLIYNTSTPIISGLILLYILYNIYILVTFIKRYKKKERIKNEK